MSKSKEPDKFTAYYGNVKHDLFSMLEFQDVSSYYTQGGFIECAVIMTSNGYGASIIHGNGFNGYELVMLTGTLTKYTKCTDTSIIPKSCIDGIDGLTKMEVTILLHHIIQLPPVSSTPYNRKWWDLAGLLTDTYNYFIKWK